MEFRRFVSRFAVAATSMALASVAFAHPKLLSSTPQDNAEGPAPQKIELHFSENLMTQFSGASLIMTSMPGATDHSTMKVAAKVSGSDDPKAMVITPAQPLTAGTYRVDWRAVSSDTHPITGKISFIVK
ncbi:copper homeostasis periplasmic binding protein CopC [Burkholderia diffusa]|uniref:copper homeostasis periplasmic binding protein CopC n=2 Tax=Burkholderia diffusa TaxID=488732 RepID=UPI00158A71DB|nr:copper homeostasis periplasmic binding protein CopC [Burkholderia diffusa]